MEDNSQKRTSRTSSSTSSPMSKEDKLKRSMKGLSHMNGGMGGGASFDGAKLLRLLVRRRMDALVPHTGSG